MSGNVSDLVTPASGLGTLDAATGNGDAGRSMRAVTMTRFGGPEVLECRRVPVPGVAADEVLIRIAFCGVCRHDLLTRQGAFPRARIPVILGHQVSGTVAAVGRSVRAFAPGDRVMTTIFLGCGACDRCRSGNASLCERQRPDFLGEDVDGGYAEFVARRVDGVVAVPGGVSLAQAAIVVCTLGTAWHALRGRARLEPGEVVAITGASGGVGSHAVQVAAVLGARVVAITSSTAKADALRRLGAAEVVVAPGSRFAHEVKAFTRGLGADVVLEIVGAKTLTESLHAVRAGGRVVVVGNVDGAAAELRPAHLILKEVALLGTKSCTAAELAEVMERVADGRLRAEVEAELPLEDAVELHRSMERGEGQGRSVLAVAGE